VKLGGYKIPFHTFDAAFTVLWAKKNPNTPLPEMESTVLRHSDLLTDILDSLGNIPIVGPVPKIGFFLDKISRAAQKWWKTRGVQALKDIADMEPPEIEALLPRFFGDDINAYLQSRPRKIVILIDTYEALWEQPHLRAAQGHPYALDLALTHIEKIRDMGKTPTPDDIGDNPRELFERFMKNLEGNEQETLKVLSVPRRWDKDIFETLIKRFNTGYPLTRFSEFHRYSFIETTETPGEYGMHDVMRSSLHGWTDPGLRKDAHETMRAYYAESLEMEEGAAITPHHETCLEEAAYHAFGCKTAVGVKEFLDEYYEVFQKNYRIEVLVPLYEQPFLGVGGVAVT
jgi:hypothetical protein